MLIVKVILMVFIGTNVPADMSVTEIQKSVTGKWQIVLQQNMDDGDTQGVNKDKKMELEFLADGTLISCEGNSCSRGRWKVEAGGRLIIDMDGDSDSRRAMIRFVADRKSAEHFRLRYKGKLSWLLFLQKI